MAKRKAAKGDVTSLHPPCNEKKNGCKKLAVYSKTDVSTGIMEYWCADCFKKRVISRNPKLYEDSPKKAKPKHKKVRRVKK